METQAGGRNRELQEAPGAMPGVVQGPQELCLTVSSGQPRVPRSPTQGGRTWNYTALGLALVLPLSSDLRHVSGLASIVFHILHLQNVGKKTHLTALSKGLLQVTHMKHLEPCLALSKR